MYEREEWGESVKRRKSEEEDVERRGGRNRCRRRRRRRKERRDEGKGKMKKEVMTFESRKGQAILGLGSSLSVNDIYSTLSPCASVFCPTRKLIY